MYQKHCISLSYINITLTYTTLISIPYGAVNREIGNNSYCTISIDIFTDVCIVTTLNICSGTVIIVLVGKHIQYYNM